MSNNSGDSNLLRDQSDGRPAASRVEAFADLARRRTAGEMVLLPRMLTGYDRRVRVRQTIREDHETRIATRNEETQAKFDKLAGSLFSFFRGTALLFYRDMVGEDAWMPTVLAAGDVHPQNFGVVPNADDVPVFGVNDYDEAAYAPFTWDLKRGATAFMLAAGYEGGKGKKKQRSIAGAFVRGYAEYIASYAADGTETEDELRRDNSPQVIAELIKDATSGSRSKYLAKKYLDETRQRFASSKKIVPISSRHEEFQDLIDQYVRDSNIQVPARAAGMRVKDVAERKGQGTASLGLTRYYVLIAGPGDDGSDDVLLEIKRARRSALTGLVPASDFNSTDADPATDVTHHHGARVADAHRVSMVNPGVFYGSLTHEGNSFLVRERSWYRDDVDLADLSSADWHQYARVSGRVLARAHAMSDEDGKIDHDIEPAITSAIGAVDLFAQDIIHFAVDAAHRVRRDHETFRADHALGAFATLDLVYR
ncbi:MAG: DUF2252 domain-containing protein [Actinomycetota bacterium]|nr:DUF2252 domain-containing protein [Actinomycetota bacterium]